MGSSLIEYLDANMDDYLKASERASRAKVDQSYAVARQATKLRVKHGVSRIELAERTGIPYAEIKGIESGEITPTSATLARIAEVLGAEICLVERPL